MCAQAAAGKIERGAGAGARLEEQIRQGKRRRVRGPHRQADPAGGGSFSARSRMVVNCIAGQSLERDEVAQPPGAVLL